MKCKLLILAICLTFMMDCEKGEREDFFDLDGNQISQLEFKLKRETGTIVVYYENGNKKASVTLINGDMKRILEWYENGNLKYETVYKDNSTLNRHEKEWYKNGKIKSEIGYKKDKMHGKIRRWYENGQKESECEYFEGKPHGRWVWWRENGQMWALEEYRYGELNGKHIDWDKNGKITRETIFKDGKMISDKYPQKNKTK
ncbi:MAG: toxin-antitoxin system YwqK family antitoxin [Candidatus Aminicenantes bacterium]|nr:MAG: toxin-antitoxin system YwqK family antitoxin [Candidatus Aminicenantes bacterium]